MILGLLSILWRFLWQHRLLLKQTSWKRFELWQQLLKSKPQSVSCRLYNNCTAKMCFISYNNKFYGAYFYLIVLFCFGQQWKYWLKYSFYNLLFLPNPWFIAISPGILGFFNRISPFSPSFFLFYSIPDPILLILITFFGWTGKNLRISQCLLRYVKVKFLEF